MHVSKLKAMAGESGRAVVAYSSKSNALARSMTDPDCDFNLQAGMVPVDMRGQDHVVVGSTKRQSSVLLLMTGFVIGLHREVCLLELAWVHMLLSESICHTDTW